jgi:hypothetical protein
MLLLIVAFAEVDAAGVEKSLEVVIVCRLASETNDTVQDLCV